MNKIKIPPCKCGHPSFDHVSLEMRFEDDTVTVVDPSLCRYMCGCKGYQRNEIQ